MDVLELPRPVINFLRTMAKEGCRYVLSWDIFGGTDAVTLTLTWKLNDDQPPPPPPPEQVYDDLHIRHRDSISSARRSRRDVNPPTRSSRGKSLENHSQINTKPIVCHPAHIPSMINRQKKESEPIYANLAYLKSPASPSNNNPPLPIICSNQRPTDTTIFSKLKRINRISLRNDDDDDHHTRDPWVKRFDYSPDEKTEMIAGKVKFKGKPDYF